MPTLTQALLWGVLTIALDFMGMFVWVLGSRLSSSGPNGTPGGVVWFAGGAVCLLGTLCGVHALKLAVQVGWRGVEVDWAWLVAAGSLLAAAFGGLCALGYGVMAYETLVRH
ncbi:MAG TPA: hypothetical protein VMB50_09175 [Myxococcales bacterium]|nr:hypothetical protein [Myxococcales bacterium]